MDTYTSGNRTPPIDVDVHVTRTLDQITYLYNLITRQGIPGTAADTEGTELADLMAHAGILAWIIDPVRPQPDPGHPHTSTPTLLGVSARSVH
ncbi:MAG: hypothetical protein ACRDNF_25025 [Streptosporangiaceae bacterium]